MHIATFKLEEYFSRYEFSARWLLSPSDCEPLSLVELLDGAPTQDLQLWRNLRLGYTETQGHPVLREIIASMYDHVEPNQVVVAAPEEAIFLAMNTLLQPGDHVVTVSPAYQSLYEIARAIGCDVSPWPVALEEGNWKLDLSHLRELVTPRTKLVVVNFPHNPTGFLPDATDFVEIVEIARKNGAWLFADEMYRWLEHDEQDRLPACVDVYEKGISLCGLSKTFALPGLRIGWLASRDQAFRHALLRMKDYTTICNSAPSEVLGIFALKQANQLRLRSQGLVKTNLRVAESFFNARSHLFTWMAPKAGSIAFPQLDDRFPAYEFCEKVVAESGVMVVPGNCFDVSGNHVRIGFGRKDFPNALDQFGAYLDKTL